MKIKELELIHKESVHELLQELNVVELFRMCILYNAKFKNIVTDEVRKFSVEASKLFISDLGEGQDSRDPEEYLDLQIKHCSKYIG